MVRKFLEALPLAAFVLALSAAIFSFGLYRGATDQQPGPFMLRVIEHFRIVTGLHKPDNWAIEIPTESFRRTATQPERAGDGLLFVVGLKADKANLVRVMDRAGTIVYEWEPHWQDVGFNPRYLPKTSRPAPNANRHIHGAVIGPDGHLFLNYEGYATVGYDACGQLVWALRNLGHHSIDWDNDGNLLVSAKRLPADGLNPRYVNHRAPFLDYTVQRVTRSGEILEDKQILEILLDNDLRGLAHINTVIRPLYTDVSRNTLHANDAEVFPTDLEEGVLKHGDLMLSMRNINTVIIVDPETWQIKHRFTGNFLRQHDPDFISGDKILVYDNQNLEPLARGEDRRTRILEFDLRTGATREVFRTPFAYYTPIMGKHQRLDNGNLLVTVSLQGIALEITPEGEIAWAWANEYKPGVSAIITEVSELPAEMDRAFFERIGANCR